VLTTKTHKTLAVALATVIFLTAATTADDKRLSIYSSVATYTLPVIDRLGREYVSLLEVLEPLGRISAHAEGQHWKMRFNNTDSDFVAGKTRIKIRGRDFTLTAPFLIDNSRGLVPINSLSALLPAFLGKFGPWVDVAAVAGAVRVLMTRPDSTPLLPQIHCPTLIVVGDEDTITPPALSEDMHRGIAGSELVVIAGAGHLSSVEQAYAFNDVLARFLTHRV